MMFSSPPVRFVVTVLSLWVGARATLIAWQDGIVAPATRTETQWASADPIEPARSPALQPVAAMIPARLAMNSTATGTAVGSGIGADIGQDIGIGTATDTMPQPAVRPASYAALPRLSGRMPDPGGGFDTTALLLIASYGGAPSIPAAMNGPSDAALTLTTAPDAPLAPGGPAIAPALPAVHEERAATIALFVADGPAVTSPA